MGFPWFALLLYKQMVGMGFKHDGYTLPIVNRAVWFYNGFVGIVHCVGVKVGFCSDVYFCNTLVVGYVRSSLLGCARKVFEEMFVRDVVSWTSVVSGYVCEGCVSEGFELFERMRWEVELNNVTLIVLLQGCCVSGMLVEGRQLHGVVIKNGGLVDGAVRNSVLRLYAVMSCCRGVEDFFGEFESRDVICWNIFMGYICSLGDIARVVERFKEMRNEVVPGVETLTLILSALSKCGDLIGGKMLHCFSVKTGIHDVVLLTSLLDFYVKCGQLRTATQLFREIPCRNSNISWAAMISGFVRNGYFQEAIDLCLEMQALGLKPDTEVLKSLIEGCIYLGAFRLGKAIHGYIIRNLLQGCMAENTELETTVLNMYIRCGEILAARAWFDNIFFKDVVIWTSMIEGYGTHGRGYDALETFYLMIDEGIKPNSVTFLSLLSACSHSGLMNEGCEILHSMKWTYGEVPGLEHYTCLVDLLGRAGRLKEALAIVIKLVLLPDGRIWGALLAASRIYGDKMLAEYAAKRLFELEPDNVGYYTVLSNVQASAGQWAEVENIRRAVNEMALKKKPGTSWFGK